MNDPKYALTSFLAEIFTSSGEVVSIPDMAEEIFQFERENELVEFTQAEILSSFYEAADSFVNSMIENDNETPESAWGLEDGECPVKAAEARIEAWEAMRPRNLRIKAISSIQA